METTPTENTYTIDATGKRLGKVATEAAAVLLGKTTPRFTKHTVVPTHVIIANVSALDIPDAKRFEIYQSYSGYPGGRRTETLDRLANRLGYTEVVRRTIAGMLPNNKLKKQRLKQLTVTE